MKARWTIIGALGGAAAVYLALGAREPAAPAPVVAEHRTVVVRESAPRGATFTTPAPGVAAATMTEATAGPSAPEPPPPPTAEQEAAAATAMTVVDGAITAGRWTDADNVRLGQVMHTLHIEDRDAVMTEWATAVNEQRLRVEAPPAF